VPDLLTRQNVVGKVVAEFRGNLLLSSEKLSMQHKRSDWNGVDGLKDPFECQPVGGESNNATPAVVCKAKAIEQSKERKRESVKITSLAAANSKYNGIMYAHAQATGVIPNKRHHHLDDAQQKAKPDARVDD
jgi:hypothetical protein